MLPARRRQNSAVRQCLRAFPAALWLAIAAGGPLLAQAPGVVSRAAEEPADNDLTQRELTSESFAKKTEDEQRRALIEAIDRYDGIARKPVVRAEGTYWMIQDMGGLYGYGRPNGAPAKGASEKAKIMTDFFCLFDSERARWTSHAPGFDADGRIRVGRYENGSDGRRFIELRYEDAAEPVSARVSQSAASRPRARMSPLLYDGLRFGLTSFDYAAANKDERGSMQKFISEADTIDIEQRKEEPLVVHVRKKVHEKTPGVTTEYIRTFRIEPVVHCIRRSWESGGPRGITVVTVEIEYDWRDGAWLPVRSTRTAASGLPGGRLSLLSKVSMEYTKLEFLDSAADEEFLPKIPEGIPVRE